MPFDGNERRHERVVRLEVLRDLCSKNMKADQNYWSTCLWSEARTCGRLPDLPFSGEVRLRSFTWRVRRYFGITWVEEGEIFGHSPKRLKLPVIERALARALARGWHETRVASRRT